MICYKQDEVKSFLLQGEKEIKLFLVPDFLTKIQLYLMGNVNKGIDLIDIGVNRVVKGYGFLLEFMDLIEYAGWKKYKVLIQKEDMEWYLIFLKL